MPDGKCSESHPVSTHVTIPCQFDGLDPAFGSDTLGRGHGTGAGGDIQHFAAGTGSDTGNQLIATELEETL